MEVNNLKTKIPRASASIETNRWNTDKQNLKKKYW